MSMKTIFHDKMSGGGSMTRLTVFLFTFACTINISPAMGWPFAFVCVATLFSLPFSKLFEGKDGSQLLGKLLDKFGVGAIGTGKGGLVEVAESVVENVWPDNRTDDER